MAMRTFTVVIETPAELDSALGKARLVETLEVRDEALVFSPVISLGLVEARWE